MHVHSFCISPVAGDRGKMKICLNLVKSFCGDGSKFNQIENDINQIKASPPIVKIQGKVVHKF